MFFNNPNFQKTVDSSFKNFGSMCERSANQYTNSSIWTETALGLSSLSIDRLIDSIQ